MIKLDNQLRESIRTGAAEVQVGKPVPWSLFDAEGRLLLRKSAVIESEAQLAYLADRAVYRLTVEPGAAHREEVQRKAPFFATGELMARLSILLDAIAAGKAHDDALAQLRGVCTEIQVMCAADADAALAAIHLDREGKYGVRHLVHTALLVELVSYRLGYSPDERHRVIAAALTTNLGMLLLQEQLQMQDSVSEQQRQQISAHPERGVELLWHAGVRDKLWLEMVMQHHERMDGSGYPRGLQGNEIAEGSRIIAMADIYHAMISNRAYRQGMLPTSALRQVFLGQGKDIDQQLAKVFIKELGVYPPGGFVFLYNGELAVVTHRGVDGISPRVGSLISPRGASYPRPLSRDTSVKEFAIKETAMRDESVLLTNLLPLWGY